MKKPPQKHLVVFSILIAIIVTSAIICFINSSLNFLPHTIGVATQSKTAEPFPDIDTSNLNTVQQKIVTLTHAEFDAQPAGTKYSAGVTEAWCADFVSWIMNAAGQPFVNPNSGSWRIPGIYTLREYYESVGRFKTPDSGYSPKTGDVMIYNNPSPFGQHTNIVIKNDHGIITTIGGNEYNRIRVHTHTNADKVGITGYGILE